jgi:asparagine synthase (glutamine-hydrolysing)
MAAMRGVEPRHPFSDRRMIEFFLSLPLKMKTYSPLPKRVIREGMKGILPEIVRNRTHFAHPGGAFLLSLLSRCSDLLQEDKFKALLAPIVEYVNVEQLESDRLRWLTGASVDAYSLWQVLNLSIWMQGRGCT